MVECKLTQVTFPDYHISPGSDKVLVISSPDDFEMIVDVVNKYWPQREATLYFGLSDMGSSLSRSQTNPESSIEDFRLQYLTWLHYQLAIVDHIWISTRFSNDVWPIISRYSNKISFFSHGTYIAPNFVMDYTLTENVSSKRFTSIEDLIAASIFKLT